MKPAVAVRSFLILLLLTYLVFDTSTPRDREDADLPPTEFSIDRAMSHVNQIGEKPHGVGFPAHSEVRRYVVRTLEGMGLQPQIQSGYTAGDWGNLSKAVNIMARIPGSRPGKALVLMSHYDSSPHSSYGASDAGSGVATILEGLRAYLASGAKPENDIIVLITDAEELGLNGADLFVSQHPWIQDVGLVLNFEGRGSGGTSFMLVETNRGNSRLIEEFAKADPDFPVANSLAYSIYKMLPNDTDLTVFREDGDIEGFNFAFIDDHYDYHTALDIPERLDRRTLAHQGSYLMALLPHFASADLTQLKSLNDRVYFNLPFYGLVSYPFDWNGPLWILTLVLFLAVLIHGLRRGSLSWRGIGLGFIPMFILLILAGLAGYAAWPMLTSLYPSYKDMLHGFTYNGHIYIGAWSALSLGLGFLAYSRYRRLRPADVLVAPMVLWLVLCGLLNNYLPGAAFLIIPGLALLASLLMSTHQEHPNPYILTLVGIPILWILAPFAKVLPVGLGLNMMITTSLMTAFIFLLLLGVLHRYPRKRRMGGIGMLLFLLLLVGAHIYSGFTEDRPKPTSLLYVMNTDDDTSFWTTYEDVPSAWTRGYLGDEPSTPAEAGLKTLSSKYSTGFSYAAEAPAKGIPGPIIRVERDTVIGAERSLAIRVIPRRPVNRLEVLTNEIALKQAQVNGIVLSEYYLENRRGGKLITHYISNDESTFIELSFPAGESLELTFYEASNDLLSNPHFSIPPRGKELIPMPFVLNDAVLTINSLRFE